MLSINIEDVIKVLDSMKPQLIGFGVVLVLAIVAMIACMKLPKAKKYMIRCQAGLAILLALVVGGHAVNWTIFGLLALPLILCRTHSGIRIPKWFFYAFYPAHLAIIALVGWCMGV